MGAVRADRRDRERHDAAAERVGALEEHLDVVVGETREKTGAPVARAQHHRVAPAADQPAPQVLPTCGITRRSTTFAVATFLSRLATTASTVTAAWLSCHTS